MPYDALSATTATSAVLGSDLGARRAGPRCRGVAEDLAGMRMQRASCPSATRSSGGSLVVHASRTYAQRGAKRQPSGR